MAEVKSYDTKDGFIIEIKLDETDDRICDYCNMLLVQYNRERKKLICLQNCYTTAYGLMCETCKGNIEPAVLHKEGDVF